MPNLAIYIRSLKREDALTSYKWRNNPLIWELTGSKPDIEITKEIELSWIDKILKRKNEKRFAICIEKTNQYIGNVQLTNIQNKKAEFHIFIGETKFWGKNIATIATNKVLNFADNDLKLKEVYLWVKKENIAAIRVYEKCGFIGSEEEGRLKMKYMF